MAFPYVEEDCFENGSTVGTESDTGSLLDFPHYSTLARTPGLPMPFRGAYCMRIQPGDTNAHTITYADVNISLDAVAWSRFYVWHEIEATADDIFNIYELKASSTVEGAVSLRVTAATGLVEIGIGETAASTFACALSPGQWHCVELKANLDDGSSNDGALDLYVDGYPVQSATDLDQGAITDALLGTTGTLSTTTGAIYFDEYVHDDLRIGPIRDRWTESNDVTISRHVAIGPCCVDAANLISGTGTDTYLELYDSDEVIRTDSVTVAGTLKWRLDHVAPSLDTPLEFHRGVYAVIGGTTPRALVHLTRATAYGSEGAVRSWAATRKAYPIGA